MPYKANDARRHKIPRARYKVTNWPEYDRALQQRGSLTRISQTSTGIACRYSTFESEINVLQLFDLQSKEDSLFEPRSGKHVAYAASA